WSSSAALPSRRGPPGATGAAPRCRPDRLPRLRHSGSNPNRKHHERDRELPLRDLPVLSHASAGAAVADVRLRAVLPGHAAVRVGAARRAWAGATTARAVVAPAAGREPRGTGIAGAQATGGAAHRETHRAAARRRCGAGPEGP